MKSNKPLYKRWYFITTCAIVLATIIFNIFFTVVVISGNSMEPNYHNGNIELASRCYEINRFDVVIIDALDKSDTILIKRVIGLPGDTIEYKDNYLYINGDYKEDIYGSGETEDFIITLKSNEYYCLGDNREHSLDSRTYGAFTDKDIFAKLTTKRHEVNN